MSQLAAIPWNVPNALTLSRLPLTIVLCALIEFRLWPAALATFAVAALTDWIDGWWARKFNQGSSFGRTFDPLTDKVLLGAAFIFLIPVPEAGMVPWIVATVIGRELLITGVRGYVESLGHKFGADWFGKLKTILQCAALAIILMARSIDGREWSSELMGQVVVLQYGTVYAMVAATVLSGVQYCFKAATLLKSV